MVLLGTPYKRGQSDVITSAEFDAGTVIEEGLAVAKTKDGKIKAYTGAETPVGVMGGVKGRGGAVVEAGLEVYVQVDNGEADPDVANKQVYVKADGTFTATQAGNKAINAFFTGEAKKDAVVNNKGEAKKVKALKISFVGGF